MIEEAPNHGLERGDTLLRVAGISLIAGPLVLLTVGGLSIPIYGAGSGISDFFNSVYDNRLYWRVDHLLRAFTFVAVLIGVAGIRSSIGTGPGSAWVRIGFYVLAIGTTIWIVELATAGVGLLKVVSAWREEFGADALVSFHVAVAVDGIVAALQSMAIVVYSFALVFIGLGMSEASPYPRWLGWSAIALGAATVPTGILWANTTETLVYAFGVLAALTALWAITVGVWITRKVW